MTSSIDMVKHQLDKLIREHPESIMNMLNSDVGIEVKITDEFNLTALEATSNDIY